MASKLFTRSRPVTFDVNPSPETMFHLPMSPSEPGKFDFYRVHLANQNGHVDSTYSDNTDTPTLAAPSTTTERRWTPFADLVTPTESMSTNSSSSLNPIRTSRSQTISLPDADAPSLVTKTRNESIQSASSFSSLTEMVKNAMNKNQLTVNQMRRPASGTTLTSKDLNHLSPQSM